jgi:hypothetical protein
MLEEPPSRRGSSQQITLGDHGIPDDGIHDQERVRPDPANEFSLECLKWFETRAEPKKDGLLVLDTLDQRLLRGHYAPDSAIPFVHGTEWV